MDFSDIDPRLMASGTGAWADETNNKDSISMPYQPTSHNQSAAVNDNFADHSDNPFGPAGCDSAAGQDNVDQHCSSHTFHNLLTSSISQASPASFSSLAPGYTAMLAQLSHYSTTTSATLPGIPGICLRGRTDSLSPARITRMSSPREALPVQLPQTSQHSADMDSPLYDTFSTATPDYDPQASMNTARDFTLLHPMTNTPGIPNGDTCSYMTQESTITNVDEGSRSNAHDTERTTSHRTIGVPDSKTGRYKGYIKSEAEAEDLFKQYLAQHDTDEGSLEGLPQDSAGRRRLVRQAVDAMMQLEGSREAAEAEKAEGGAKRRLTAYNRVLEHFWSDLELELMGWRLLSACRDAQLGKCQVAGWSTDRRMSNRCKTFDTFAGRWNEVLNQLRVSKRTVKALFDTPFVNRLAWNVAGEGKRIEANQKGNAKKGKMLRERTRDERVRN
ncbi:hypothetical protein DL769_006697 [Monosporascus sp. CRB-8-3]|nr:hypothetical protein DL769_006697 [Monosporascus sp. CRB-8-3]